MVSQSRSGGGVGGVGLEKTITGSPAFYAGGGGGSSESAGANSGGNGGGGTGKPCGADAGTANTGGGGGGSGSPPGTSPGGAGGSGVVVVKELVKASGVWSMQSQLSAKSAGTWPKPKDSFTLDYLVVAGGGGSGGAQGNPAHHSGGGGAGGYRASGYGPTPLRAPSLTVSGFCGVSIPVTIGGGGSAGAGGGANPGGRGNDTIFDTITSTGGGS